MKAKTEKNSEGYLIFKNSGKYVHRWLAEKKYGKESIKDKHIHHIDGDKTNNKRSNIVLLSKEDHYDITQHENRSKLLTDFIIYLSLIYLITINLLMYTTILK
ncbi:MAG: HNH endonuclease [Nanoarchaeota archaeon]|nr:HNH endonuclease [Nanoarchaeota archaeon]MBU1623303.1 HNH endonuclease [Nanoarchaeota archaeon]MBU1974690.1 HNH endonuclease [Nanoarchaeota archaeon]